MLYGGGSVGGITAKFDKLAMVSLGAASGGDGARLCVLLLGGTTAHPLYGNNKNNSNKNRRQGEDALEGTDDGGKTVPGSEIPRH